jgi:hypothetical protein
MTPEELRQAREDLGLMWGLGRPLQMQELGRILRLGGRDVGTQVGRWEKGLHKVPGPAALAIELMLRGAKPQAIIRKEG